MFHTCTVCLDVNIYKIYKILPCGHKFHRKCIKPWAKDCNSCPLCRKAIDKNRPIVKCRVHSENEDRELALRIEQAEYDIGQFMNDLVADVANWSCVECNSNPCICDRDLEE